MCDTCHGRPVWDNLNGKDVLVECPDCAPAWTEPEPVNIWTPEQVKRTARLIDSLRGHDEMREWRDE